MQKVHLSVVIVTNGGVEELKRTLKAASDHCQGVGNIDFFVVDNATADETPELLKALAGGVREGRGVRTQTPLTPHAAWMLGKQGAKGEYVLLSSTDISLAPGWLQPAIGALAADATCDAAAPAQVLNGQVFPSQPLTSLTGMCLLVRDSTDVSAIREARYVPESVVTLQLQPHQLPVS